MAGVELIDTGVFFTSVTEPATITDTAEYTMLRANLRGSNFNSPAVAQDPGVQVVQPVPVGYKVVLTNLYTMAYDEIQNGTNCWVAAAHGHGVRMKLRKGNSVLTPATAPAVVPPWDNMLAPMGSYYGYTAPWTLAGATGDIQQGMHFGSRIYLEVKESEYITVSVERDTGASLGAAGTHELQVCIRLTGFLLPAGYSMDLRHWLGAVTL